MKQKQKTIVNRYTASTFLFLIVATVIAGIAFRHNRSEAAPATKPAVAAAVPSQFKFTGASGWWQGATNKTSMAVFQDSSNCFVSAEYKTGTVDASAELQKTQSNLTASSYVVTPAASQILALQTASGFKQYTLQQFSVTSPAGATRVQGGQEFGYVQLAKGYVKIMGHCNTSGQLPTTIPALRAIKFAN